MGKHQNNRSDFPDFSRRNLLKLAGAAAALGPLGLLVPERAFASGGRMLVLYYSKTGNTRELARYIQKTTNADIAEISPVTPYPSDYNETVRLSRLELLTGRRNPIQPLNVQLQQYDSIFLGTPLWWGTLAIPVLQFLTQHSLEGKRVLPFSTNAGGNRDKIFDDLLLLCPKSDVRSPLALRAGDLKNAQSEVNAWLRG